MDGVVSWLVANWDWLYVGIWQVSLVLVLLAFLVIQLGEEDSDGGTD